MSPELLTGQLCFRYNSKSDIWSLGVLWYELEMLQIPVNPTNIPQLLQRINDGELDALPAQDCAVMSDLDVNILDINSNVRPRTDDLLHDSIVVNLMKEFVTYMCGPGLSVEERQQSAQHIGIMKYSARLSGYLEHCHAFESLMETRFNDSVAKPQCFFPHTETDEYLTLFCIAFSTLAALPVLLKSSPDLISNLRGEGKVVRRQMRKQLYVEFRCAKAIENITEFITLNRSQLLNEHSSQALVMISKYKPPVLTASPPHRPLQPPRTCATSRPSSFVFAIVSHEHTHSNKQSSLITILPSLEPLRISTYSFKSTLLAPHPTPRFQLASTTDWWCVIKGEVLIKRTPYFFVDQTPLLFILTHPKPHHAVSVTVTQRNTLNNHVYIAW
ncbi:hypothetical protein BLNAU_1646 [Blattamonas nauphoetae]|uniref:non-specific serine/threonine protein kinase n=1 Tax=Blattamonas nauphoetae TaxID=2049346 RepID=A0ABQ9YHB4_9EUKA|nr:hypothetical protein BLNAU_1646 [Blattamonas nauphoetae]